MNDNSPNTIENEGKRRKITAKALVIESIIALVLTILFAWAMGIFAVEQSGEGSVSAVLSDAAFITGVLFAGVGGISWVVSEGTFDVFSYGAKMVWEHFHIRQTEFEKYYEYKQRKAQAGTAWLSDFVIVGVIFLVLAGIFLLISQA